MGTPSRYVTDLRGWELPRADELELQLLDELIKKTRGKALTPGVLGEELYSVFIDRLRVIAGASVNEAIEYWLKGLGNGSHPELCAEFPLSSAIITSDRPWAVGFLFTRAPTNTHGASHRVLPSHARNESRRADAEKTTTARPNSREDQERLDPTLCADARGCNVSPKL